nr:laccase-4-like [Onthophagus taurus]XP_022908343.1 laccase-4-like [Onthophagus taurus]
MFFKCELIGFIILLSSISISHTLDSYKANNSSNYNANFPHPCKRKCVKNSKPMECKFTFNVEWYQTMSKACHNCPHQIEDCFLTDCIPGDGSYRSVLVINRMLPGPKIEVCYGDEIVVDVQNELIDSSTTIHWHGHPQRGTPYMDGVPYVTQCPIQPGTTFRYRFPANIVGTHVWHSHLGMQRTDGAFGAIIVRTPDDINPHKDLYDYDEHSILITDWMEHTGLHKFLSHYHSIGDNKPTSILVNGKGKYLRFSQKDGTEVFTPIERFVVKKGFKYRFRLINVSFMNCPIEMSIDGHSFRVISTDGHDVEAIEAESLVSYAGERFDFILNANQTEGLYWIKFRGLMDCDERFTSAYQVAVLQYSNSSSVDFPEGDVDYQKTLRKGLQLNSLNKGLETADIISIPQLKSLNEPDLSLKPIPDFQYFVSYDFYKIDNPHFHKNGLYGFNEVTNNLNKVLTPQLNHITMKMPSTPLLQNRHRFKPDMFCNETTVKKCDKDFCECTHVIKIPLGNVVELILIDKGFAYDANHPFHLHGTSFRVVGMERIGQNVTVQEIMDMDKQNLLKRNLKDPPIKDTVTTPDGGYTILRFIADNPGFWLFHCHIEFHSEVGMSMVFQFGEIHEMPPVPIDFPNCGNYLNSPISQFNEPQELASFNQSESGTDHPWWYSVFSGNEKSVKVNVFVTFSVIFLKYLCV